MIEFWLSFNNGAEKLRLPVPPSTVEISTGILTSVLNINDLGEVLLIGKRKLKGISFSTYFPIQDDGLCQYKNFPSPAQCLDMISKWRNSGRPLRLMIIGKSLKVNEAMVIESFNPSLKRGPEDVYFTIDLKEYRFVNEQDNNPVDPTAVSLSTFTGQPRSTENAVPSSYTMRAGDTLYTIGKQFGLSWQDLKTKNNISDERKIAVGFVLKL